MINTRNSGQKSLQIFDSFQVDTTLPKYLNRKVELSDTQQTGFVSFANNGNFVVGTSNSNSIVSVTPTGFTQQVYISENPIVPLVSRLKDKIGKAFSALFIKSKTIYVRITSTPVEQTFEAIIGSGKKLEILEGRLEAHRSAIEEAKAMGQIALSEKLIEEIPYKETEAILFAGGYKEFITEDLLIQFAEKCERGLALDWIKNFTRLIPHDIRIKKTKMDTLNAFDNYVILHFDPNKQNSALTKKEIEKKKDPILFGVVKGSRKLYHVGSWKDEYCDLSFSDLVDKFGKDALKLK